MQLSYAYLFVIKDSNIRLLVINNLMLFNGYILGLLRTLDPLCTLCLKNVVSNFLQ